ncbi:MAG: hypothetical protein PHF86_02515 [Candidatus Nanoarchaeia archaeon]|nr:hypothetical protein [Candidatus Nanoarchaeia archaeon]
MVTQYGTKDLMRLMDIQKKSNGDLIEAFKLAYRMANEIEEPGKALARGWAAIEVYKSLYSPIAGIFFQRACDLTGETSIQNIKVMASMNSVGDNEDAIEEAYSRIPVEKQPASRRSPESWEKIEVSNKRGFSDIISMGKVNVVKGTGPGFDMKYMKNGTIELWKTSEEKIRIVYTGGYLPTASIGDQKDFKFIGGQRETWTMIDYIEVYNMMNLQPLYGASITGYMYN